MKAAGDHIDGLALWQIYQVLGSKKLVATKKKAARFIITDDYYHTRGFRAFDTLMCTK
jgi:hypothetical protein